MKKLEIYRIALAQHAKSCTQEEMDATVKPTEVEACDRMYEMAVQDVLGEYDWSFCVRPVNLILEDDEPHGRWAHGYALPSGLIRIVRTLPRQKPFRISNGRYYTNEDNPETWGITMDSGIMEMAPRDFCNLVGLWLGYLISTIVSPSDTNLANRILQNYSAHLHSLMQRENQSVQDNYLDEDDWSARKGRL